MGLGGGGLSRGGGGDVGSGLDVCSGRAVWERPRLQLLTPGSESENLLNTAAFTDANTYDRVQPTS